METDKYIGRKYSHWKVVSFSHTTSTGHQYYNCICDCGKYKSVRLSKLIHGESKSCGCKRRELYDKGGSESGKRTKLYRVWLGIRDRCNNPNNISYNRYGAKGVSICKEWEDFSTFKKWSEDNGYKDGLSIDRIDSKIGYEPNNCRWADSYTQANNTCKNLFVKAEGECLTISQWARKLNIKYHFLYGALKSRKGRNNLMKYFPNSKEQDLIPFKKY